MDIIRTSFKSFLFNILGSGLGFIFNLLAAKYLGSTIFGEANSYFGYSLTITIFISFGLQVYLAQKLPKEKEKGRLFSEVVITFTALAIVVQPVFFILARFKGVDLLNYLMISILAYLIALAEIILTYNISLGNAVSGMFYRKFLFNAINLAVFIFLWILNFREYYIYMLIMIFSYAVTSLPFIMKNIRKAKINLMIIKGSFSFFIIQIVYGAYLSYSRVLQKDYGTTESGAVLSISLVIANLVSILGDSFAKVSMPEFARAWSDKNHKELRKVYMTISRINCFLVLPIAMLLILNAGRILGLLGKGYNGGEIIFILVLISIFINSFTGPNGTLLVMCNYAKVEMLNGIVKLVVAITVMVIFASKTTLAVALSLSASELIVNTLKCIQVKIKLGIVPYTIKELIYIIGQAICQWLVFSNIGKINSTVLWILLSGVALLISYIVTFSLSPNAEDKALIKDIKMKLHKR